MAKNHSGAIGCKSRAQPGPEDGTLGCKHLSPLALVVFVYFFNTFNGLQTEFYFHLVALRADWRTVQTTEIRCDVPVSFENRPEKDILPIGDRTEVATTATRVPIIVAMTGRLTHFDRMQASNSTASRARNRHLTEHQPI